MLLYDTLTGRYADGVDMARLVLVDRIFSDSAEGKGDDYAIDTEPKLTIDELYTKVGLPILGDKLGQSTPRSFRLRLDVDDYVSADGPVTLWVLTIEPEFIFYSGGYLKPACQI